MLLIRVADGFFAASGGLPYNPLAPEEANAWQLQLRATDGTRYRYREGELVQILASNDKQIIVSSSGMIADDGSRISILRNAAGRFPS